MTVRTAELGHSDSLSGAGVTLHTVAAGTTVIVKDWSLSHTGGATAPYILYVERGGVEYDLARQDVPAATVVGPPTPRFHVLEPGDVLKAAGQSDMGIWVSGTILAGVA